MAYRPFYALVSGGPPATVATTATVGGETSVNVADVANVARVTSSAEHADIELAELNRYEAWLIAVGRWPVRVAVLLLGLSVLYRYGPSRDEAQWSWVSPGALLAAVGWLVASLLFSWYVANFEDYNKTYGTVGAVIGLLTWMWLSATIVLVGAELNSEAERQTDRDTTKGPPMPVGMRGADAADRKG